MNHPTPDDLKEWFTDTQIRERAWESCVVRLLIERIAKAEAELREAKQECERLGQPVSDEEEGMANLLAHVHGFRFALKDLLAYRKAASKETV